MGIISSRCKSKKHRREQQSRDVVPQERNTQIKKESLKMGDHEEQLDGGNSSVGKIKQIKDALSACTLHDVGVDEGSVLLEHTAETHDRPSTRAASLKGKRENVASNHKKLPDSTNDVKAAALQSFSSSSRVSSNASSDGTRQFGTHINFVKESRGRITADYDIKPRPIGTGTYGSVSVAVCTRTGAVRAIKSIFKHQMNKLDVVKSEINVMKSLDHPNIVKLYEVYESNSGVHLVMELCRGGELFDRIIQKGHFTEQSAAVIMKQIFSALNYMHSKNIMHRDLKPENFLFLDESENSLLKIIDFGLATLFKAGVLSSTRTGTPYYVAPQVLAGSYDFACDNWSAGVIMYILLCGYPPFYGRTDAEVLQRVQAGKYQFAGQEWKNVSPQAKELISGLLNLDPSQRFTAKQALNHPWTRHIDRQQNAMLLPSALFSNLKNFQAVNRLKRVALSVIAQLMSEDDIRNLRDIFVTLDTDHSGNLSWQELSEGMTRLGWTELPPDLRSVLEQVDLDKSETIDYTEFIAATIDKRLYINKAVCWAAFNVFDTDRNGRISLEELKQLLGDRDVETFVGKDSIKNLMEEVDLNGDGEIDFDEFMQMMDKATPAHPVHSVLDAVMH